MVLFLILMTGCKPLGSPVAYSSKLNAKNSETTIDLNHWENQEKLSRGDASRLVDAWDPNQVKLTCAGGKCAEGAGLLFFAESLGGGSFKLHRCSAFLESSNKVVTTGHCDYSATSVGYFITRTDIPNPAVRKIEKSLYSLYTPAPNDPNREIETLNPAVAIFQLEKPIEKVTPMPLARGEPVEYSKLIGFVVDQKVGEDANAFELKRIECTVRTHAKSFPFAMWEAPELVRGFDCPTQQGNSGAAMVAQDGGPVEAIYQGFNPPVEGTKLAYETHWEMTATNARCLEFPTVPDKRCTKVTSEEINRRWNEYISGVVKKSWSAEVENADQYPVKFRAYSALLVSAEPAPHRQFDIYYYPVCLKRSQQLGAGIPLPIRRVELRYDEWADARVLTIPLHEPEARIARSWPEAFKYELEVQWPQMDREYVRPADGEFKTLPEQLGPKFTIELQECPG